MLVEIHPKLPMRDKLITRAFYIDKLGFSQFGSDYDGYLMVQKDQIQIHFFQFTEINPLENDGQVYIRVKDIDGWFKELKKREVNCSPLEHKPWMQREFSLLDPDNNLLTFGEPVF